MNYFTVILNLVHGTFMCLNWVKLIIWLSLNWVHIYKTTYLGSGHLEPCTLHFTGSRWFFILVDTLLKKIQSNTYMKLRSKAKKPCKNTLEKENVLREQTNK